MARWSPPPGYESGEVADRLATDLASLYAEAEQRLLGAIAAQVQSRRDDLLEDSTSRAAAVRELRASAQEIQQRLESESREQVANLVQTAHEAGARHSIRQMRQLGGITEERARQMRQDIPGMDAAQLTAADLSSRLENVSHRITRWSQDAYQTAVGAAVSERLLTGQSIHQAQRRAWESLAAQGISGFVDTSGRGWNMASYVEMATRTASGRAWNAANQASMEEAGIEFFSISDTGDACSACVEWQGEIVTEGGPTGTVQAEHGTEDGEYVEVEVRGTLDDARADGWQHPNCRCTLVPYIPGVTTLVKPDPEGREEREANRERLRECERNVRKYKNLRDAALDDDRRAYYQSKVGEWQGEIRDHIDDTGLNRRSYREAVNLGHGDHFEGIALPAEQSPDPEAELPEMPTWDDVYSAELGTYSDADLDRMVEQVMDDGWDDWQMGHISAEMDARDQARYQEQAEQTGRTEAQVRTEDEDARATRMDDLMGEGVPAHEAYAEAYGLDPAAVMREQVIADLRSQGHEGRGFDELSRASYKQHVYEQWLDAEEATNGFLLSPLGEERGIDPQDLWSMNPTHARAYASEEMLRYWAQHGRTTLADWRAMLEGGGPDRSRGAGREFGV